MRAKTEQQEKICQWAALDTNSPVGATYAEANVKT